ncbi:MAG: hypothetical protein EA396_00835 [Anaerolineaceae bacterium]|nr:MAG: hypothetical protein EA396_00835 [Anaerolineaceae bacterium]
MNSISTTHQLKRHLGLDVAGSAEDERLTAALVAATAQIERLAARWFMPRRATIYHQVARADRHHLTLKADLLDLHSVTTPDGIALTSAITRTEQGALHFDAAHPLSAHIAPDTVLAISAVWAWHPEPATAWRWSGDSVLDAMLWPGVPVIAVSSATASAPDGTTPRFQVGQLLRIGDEMMSLMGIMPGMGAGDGLLVGRGVNGTVSAAHTHDAQIERYQPPADIAQLALRWAAWLYQEPDQPALTPTPPALLSALSPLRRLTA